ncbi:MAG TPA: hypothetical protein VG387_11020 [Rhizomicrobium sp.]|jgi:hypothetical protein|nr:hypothetical protein [Rhizomicrobium sp.]
MKKIITAAAFAAMGVAVSGCATVIEGTTQSIAVTSMPRAGAKCTLSSSEGTYYVTTPGNAIVHKTKNDIAVDCTHEGYQDAHVVVSPHFNYVTFGNAILGGLIGVAVDAATGSDFNFPSAVNVTLVPVPGAAAMPQEETAPAAKPAS